MDKGITLTHLGIAFTIFSIIGAFCMGYIVLKVKTMISDSEKSIATDMSKEREKIEGKIKDLDNKQDEKHSDILVKIDEMLKSMGKIELALKGVQTIQNMGKSGKA